MLRRAARLVLLSALLVVPAARAELEPDVAAARDAALAQLEAFRGGDFDRAYTYASREIRTQFDRVAFERMVRRGYPQIAAPASVTVDGAERITGGGGVFLFLRIRGADGSAVEAIYEMVSEPEGWKVNGVVTRPDTSRRA